MPRKEFNDRAPTMAEYNDLWIDEKIRLGRGCDRSAKMQVVCDMAMALFSDHTVNEMAGALEELGSNLITLAIMRLQKEAGLTDEQRTAAMDGFEDELRDMITNREPLMD